MKTLRKILYQGLGSLALLVAVTSVFETYSFCILIIHQPDIPKKLKDKSEK